MGSNYKFRKVVAFCPANSLLFYVKLTNLPYVITYILLFTFKSLFINNRKPFEVKKSKETDDKEKENVILMEEFEDDDFDSLQQETEAAEIEKVTSLESSMAAFSTNIYILFVCRIRGVECGEQDVSGLRNTNLEESKVVLVVNDQFAISESQLEAQILSLK
ncbi:hypothetical protein AVEN_154177-1 [Araneus ventricosus]|uniref:Uncharacterized protein n=1 Tax=Araneus ventricosus TaxID=182803 RepID=A0A4Y2CWA1_ARAVE|nr:hypothetical protein AVEN_154177-1 [Araneus ventricosus]